MKKKKQTSLSFQATTAGTGHADIHAAAIQMEETGHNHQGHVTKEKPNSYRLPTVQNEAYGQRVFVNPISTKQGVEDEEEMYTEIDMHPTSADSQEDAYDYNIII